MVGKVLLTSSVRRRGKTMIKKMKNYWDYMKDEWTLFKQLMRGETGLGWDATKNTIMADDDWWERTIKENAKYKKFRNKDLSLIWFRYDALFADVIATGERARAANQEPALDLISMKKG
uniref:L10-interacting MYB domain-containing protein-like n=1 Tax=Nicotiana tabacum TaxID=4097 RepID=A0A1S3X5B6_TOBAC|nr:PREDICTED: L10-interacting MYB domain-containing protein-like [Nicotiana tabacum]